MPLQLARRHIKALNNLILNESCKAKRNRYCQKCIKALLKLKALINVFSACLFLPMPVTVIETTYIFKALTTISIY